MADDLSNVASLLRDTNKKLDKLSADNEKSNSVTSIVAQSLPEVLSDRAIASRQEKFDKHEGVTEVDEAVEENTDAVNTQGKGIIAELAAIRAMSDTVSTDITGQSKTLVNTFDGITIEHNSNQKLLENGLKTLPSDLKLMVQALSPKALMGGIKVGLGTMFKEFVGGIKNIGRGIKSLGSKGLTAAQRKSEEKEKESKENKKDSFLKKMFGKITGFLGGIFSTVSKVGGAGVLALLGAGALYALAKLIESPSWKTVAGVIEYVLNKLDDIFTWANNVGGPLGVLGTALAGWYGAKGILILAGAAVKALGKKFLGKLGLTAATKAASEALGSKANKLSLLGRLGLIGLAFAAVTTAIIFLGDELEKFRKKAADKRAIKRADKTTKALKRGDPAELKTLQEEIKAEVLVAKMAREGTEAAKARAAAEADLKRIKAAQAEALKKTQTTREAAVFGGTPKQISENLAKLFKDAFNSTTFEGNAEQRVGQVKGLIGGISKRLLTSKSFQALSDIDKEGFIKKLQSAESGAFNLVRGRGLISKQVNLGRGNLAGGARDADATDAEKKKFMLDITALQKELRLLRKSQIGKLGLADAVDADANVKRMKLLIDRLERKAMADNEKGGGIDVIGSGNNTLVTNNLSTPIVAPLVIGTAGKGQLMLYGNPF